MHAMCVERPQRCTTVQRTSNTVSLEVRYFSTRECSVASVEQIAPRNEHLVSPFLSSADTTTLSVKEVVERNSFGYGKLFLQNRVPFIEYCKLKRAAFIWDALILSFCFLTFWFNCSNFLYLPMSSTFWFRRAALLRGPIEFTRMRNIANTTTSICTCLMTCLI